MIKLGLDFDNTIVQYGNLFYKLAVEKNIIDKNIYKNKEAVREELIKRGLEHEFTRLQGEVYGSRIKEAEITKGLRNEILKIKQKGAEIVIISHKTKFPFKGPKYNLHDAADEWLAKNRFYDEKSIGLKKSQVFFEDTIELKIERIHSEKCTHYIDDLTKVLRLINTSITKIHYNPNGNLKEGDWSTIREWNELEQLIING